VLSDLLVVSLYLHAIHKKLQNGQLTETRDGKHNLGEKYPKPTLVLVHFSITNQ